MGTIFQRARERAAAATEQARGAAENLAAEAGEAVHATADAVTDEAHQAMMRERLGQGARQARAALAAAVDKVDPAMLADVIIAATALQERTNRALRLKGSPYRIADVSITAAIPPNVSFSIGRVEPTEDAEAVASASVETA